MTKVAVPELLSHFSDLPDPRKPRGIRHALSDSVIISILAVICRANTTSQIHQYALSREGWLSTFLRLPSGIPTQDTFERIFAILNPGAWQAKFLQWTKQSALAELAEGEYEILAVDGKSARGSTCEGLGALHTVSVWSLTTRTKDE